jgi:hypothetical protein
MVGGVAAGFIGGFGCYSLFQGWLPEPTICCRNMILRKKKICWILKYGVAELSGLIQRICQYSKLLKSEVV